METCDTCRSTPEGQQLIASAAETRRILTTLHLRDQQTRSTMTSAQIAREWVAPLDTRAAAVQADTAQAALAAHHAQHAMPEVAHVAPEARALGAGVHMRPRFVTIISIDS